MKTSRRFSAKFLFCLAGSVLIHGLALWAVARLTGERPVRPAEGIITLTLLEELAVEEAPVPARGNPAGPIRGSMPAKSEEPGSAEVPLRSIPPPSPVSISAAPPVAALQAPSPASPPEAAAPVVEARAPGVELSENGPVANPEHTEPGRHLNGNPIPAKSGPARETTDARSGEGGPGGSAGGGTGGVRQPAYVRKGELIYPAAARRRREEGVVLLELVVAADGTLESARIKQSSGYPDLDRAALEAEKKSRFHPALMAGRPVASRVEIPCRFRLE